MAPLYKRYIPPKPTTAPHQASPLLASKPPHQSAPHQSAPNDEAKKRKRERTEEEIAERKAKKLRKKGIDPATDIDGIISVSNHVRDAPTRTDTTGTRNGSADDASKKPQGEFAHVTNAKKRFKLQKEAREAQKAQKRADKENGISTEAQKESTSRDKSGPDDLHHTHITSKSADATSNAPPEPKSDPAEHKKWRKLAGDGKVRDPEATFESIRTGDTTKKLKKRRKEKSRDNDRPSASNQNHPEDAGTAEPQRDDPISQPKKRRHKLESVLKESQEDTQDQQADGDEHLRKHGRILDKFQKSAQRSQLAAQPDTPGVEESAQKPILLDLAPLPQPENAPAPDFTPDSSALPTWLANPTVVSSDAISSFSDLKLDPKAVQHVAKLGFNDALPVQQALIPILLPPGVPGAQYLPGTESHLPDMAVSAPTGSGKTIAYLLPIIESLKKVAGLGKLRALVVVPTRELVMQVAAVAESLARGSSVRVGMATGTGAFKEEQAKLVHRGRKYDPKGYRDLMKKAHRRNYPPAQDSDSEEFEQYLEELEEQDARVDQRIQDTVSGLVDHVPTYESAVDVLVATPGRLVEHLNGTLGFSLAHLHWLILDEADKLLDLQYDGFLETVNNELSRPHHEEGQDAREQYLRSKGAWDENRERRVRKVVLSATMTRDISKLVDLELRRPRMIVVRGAEQNIHNGPDNAPNNKANSTREAENGFELPPTLSEHCVHVGDGSEKPLYLLELLRTRILSAFEDFSARTDHPINGIDDSAEEDSEEDSSSSSDSDSDSSSSSESSSAVSSLEESSDIGASDDKDDAQDPHSEGQNGNETTIHPERAAMLERFSKPQTVPTILIFTSSTESANRLSYLLKALKPEWASWINTMTRSNAKRKSAPNAKPTEPVITISTDRAGRGLDAIATRTITHVIQYDVPSSKTVYVHRVGRTARAGKPGDAWTLYRHSEARWFLNEVATAKSIKRAGDVEKVKLGVDDEELRERFGEVVDSMRSEVFGRGRGGK